MQNFLSSLLVAIMLAFPATASAQPTPVNLVDVSGHWAERDIKMVANLGIMIGTSAAEPGGDIFSPSTPVSRAQLAAVLQRTFQFDYGDIRFIKAPLASDYYQDVSDDAWYAEAVVLGTINDIFTNSGYFAPDRAVTRLEVAQAIYRSFGAKGISVPMIMMMPVYEDTDTLSAEELNAVVFASNTGIMRGEAGFFRPGDQVQRAELARVMARCVNLMAIEENYSGQEYRVPAGRTFIVALNSNPTTGYAWTLKDAGDGQVVTKVVDFYQNEASGDEPLVGQGGRHYWQFKALQAGSAPLQLVYARPWESVQPAQVFNLTVMVTSEATSAAAQ